MTESGPTPDAPDSARLSHLDEAGRARMVDVGAKAVSEREAVAEGRVLMQAETLRLICENALRKGDVLATARIAGIQAAKRTPGLIPLCHPLALTHVEVDLDTAELDLDGFGGAVEIRARVRCCR